MDMLFFGKHVRQYDSDHSVFRLTFKSGLYKVLMQCTTDQGDSLRLESFGQSGIGGDHLATDF